MEMLLKGLLNNPAIVDAIHKLAADIKDDENIKSAIYNLNSISTINEKLDLIIKNQEKLQKGCNFNHNIL